jgi:hypothetical protein
MKQTILTAFLTLLISVSANSQELKRFFEKYGDDKRFELSSIAKDLLQMEMETTSGDVNEEDKKTLAGLQLGGIQSLQVLSSKETLTEKQLKAILKELNRIIENENYESLLEVRDKKDIVNIYTKMDENNAGDLLIMTNDEKKMNIVWIQGTISKQILNRILKNNDKNS